MHEIGVGERLKLFCVISALLGSLIHIRSHRANIRALNQWDIFSDYYPKALLNVKKEKRGNLLTFVAVLSSVVSIEQAFDDYFNSS
jgi:hypothetical protein